MTPRWSFVVAVLIHCTTVRAAFEASVARSAGPIVIDGLLDDATWARATKIDGFTQFEPRKGEPARERTEVYLLYDDTYVYFGFRVYDSQPSRITAQLNRRDSDLLSDDSVIVVLDTFHDARSAYYFATNPLGTQLDGRITDNGRVVEDTWDATWSSAAERFEEGWTAEMEIPLRHLRFRAGSGQTWGFNVGRTCRRILETSFWAGPLEHRFRISQYGSLRGLDLQAAQRRLQFIPFALGAFQEEVEDSYQIGADLRISPTPEDVINLTVNPDFAILEADQERINLTRFELALPEKRQFFLEGAEQYRQRIQTFYSRRIGDIDFGAKALGRRGGWQYSLLTAQSDPTPTSASLLGEPVPEPANYTVARSERDLWRGSTLGLTAGNRYLAGENRGSVGLDASLFFTETFRFTGQLIRSHGPEEGGRWAFFVRPSRDTATSHIHFRYTHLGDSFGDHVNAIGFIRDDDRREMDSAFEKQFWFEAGPVERFAYESNYNIYWGQSAVLRSWEIIQSVRADFRSRWSAAAWLTEEFKLFEKEFRNRQTGFLVGYNTREWQSVSLQYESGRNFDSDFRLLSVAARRKLTEDLSFEYELSRLWLSPDPEAESTYIHVVRGIQNFTKDLFLKVFFQTNSAIDRKNIQTVFVWRYRPPFGSLQLAYERGTAAFGERSEQGNTFFIKFSYVI